MTQTQTYQQAVTAIRTYSEQRQAELDYAADTARKVSTLQLRADCTKGVDTDSPLWAVACLLAQTVTVGRDDGHPTVNIPQTTKDVIFAAIRAGVVPMRASDSTITIGALNLVGDLSGLSGCYPAKQSDYEAWDAARKYRARQTWAKF